MKVRLVASVPDNVLTLLIVGVTSDNYFMAVCATREAEAVGMASHPPLSCPRKRASSTPGSISGYWVPAFAGRHHGGAIATLRSVTLPRTARPSASRLRCNVARSGSAVQHGVPHRVPDTQS